MAEKLLSSIKRGAVVSRFRAPKKSRKYKGGLVSKMKRLAKKYIKPGAVVSRFRAPKKSRKYGVKGGRVGPPKP